MTTAGRRGPARHGPASDGPAGHGSARDGRSCLHERSRTLLIGAVALPLLASTLLAGCTDDAADPDAGPSPSAAAEPSGPAAAVGDATMQLHGEQSGDVEVLAVRFEEEPEDDDEGPDPVYEEDQRTQRADLLAAQRAAGSYTPQAPLLVMDPFGTQRAGLYVFFESAGEGELSFTVSAPGSEDFSRVAQDHDPSVTIVEAQVVGLVPGARNQVTLTWTPATGEPVEHVIAIEAPEPADQYLSQLGRRLDGDETQLSDGLFAISGVFDRSNALQLFDNAGTLRGSIPTGDYWADHVRPVDGEMIYSVGTSAIARVDGLGQVHNLYDLGDYVMHHDLAVQDGIAYVLASEMDAQTNEDRILALDLSTGDVSEIVDLAEILPGYEQMAHARADAENGVKDWIHVNSIDVHGDAMYLSSRETSTIVALDGIGSEPRLNYLLGYAPLWEGSGYGDAHLTPVGDPKVIAGQHTVRRHDDPALPDGQYYLETFDNNHWQVGTRDDYAGPGPDGASPDGEFGEASYVLRYLVDENAGTYQEVQRYEVPYSSIVSSVQRTDGPDSNIVVNSGKVSTLQELTPEGELIAEYRYDADNLGYRAYKDDFAGFWYAGS